MILPVLEYCGYLYNGITNVQHKRLQTVQNRCLRVCLNVKLKYPVVDLHSDCAAAYLCERFDLQLLLLLHKYLYGGKHNHVQLGLVFHEPLSGGRTTRSHDTAILDYPTHSKMGYKRSPLYRGVDLWNSMNASCRLATNKDTFRAKAKVKIAALLAAKRLK